MKTTSEVIAAVDTGDPVTEQELRFAIQNISIWHNRILFDLARAIVEDPVSDKTRRGLQRAWDNWKSGNDVPLDKRLKGTSYEPGVSKEERHERWLNQTSETAVKLSEVLTSLKGAS